MGRNVEIKARAPDLQVLRRRVEELADEGPFIIEQEDTFFHCQTGRLKLRTFSPSKGELIFYERQDSIWPKESRYRIVPTSDPSAMREILCSALGVIGVVKKQRTLYLVGQTRVHLDIVDGLGEFMELEVVLLPEQTEADGRLIAENIMKALQIPADALVEGAYIDLLLEKIG
jgi:predicted adenylyl cyclase CyaB